MKKQIALIPTSTRSYSWKPVFSGKSFGITVVHVVCVWRGFLPLYERTSVLFRRKRRNTHGKFDRNTMFFHQHTRLAAELFCLSRRYRSFQEKESARPLNVNVVDGYDI